MRRGTCALRRKTDIVPPVFREIGSFAVVTFLVRMGATAQVAVVP